MPQRTIYAHKISAADCLDSKEKAYGKIVFIYYKGGQPGKDRPRFNVPCEVLAARRGPTTTERSSEFRIVLTEKVIQKNWNWGIEYLISTKS